MSISDAPNIWPHNPAFFCNRFQNDGGLGQPDVRLSKKPDTRPNMQLSLKKNIGQTTSSTQNMSL